MGLKLARGREAQSVGHQRRIDCWRQVTRFVYAFCTFCMRLPIRSSSNHARPTNRRPPRRSRIKPELRRSNGVQKWLFRVRLLSAFCPGLSMFARASAARLREVWRSSHLGLHRQCSQRLVGALCHVVGKELLQLLINAGCSGRREKVYRGGNSPMTRTALHCLVAFWWTHLAYP